MTAVLEKTPLKPLPTPTATLCDTDELASNPPPPRRIAEEEPDPGDQDARSSGKSATLSIPPALQYQSDTTRDQSKKRTHAFDSSRGSKRICPEAADWTEFELGSESCQYSGPFLFWPGQPEISDARVAAPPDLLDLQDGENEKLSGVLRAKLPDVQTCFMSDAAWSALLNSQHYYAQEVDWYTQPPPWEDSLDFQDSGLQRSSPSEAESPDWSSFINYSPQDTPDIASAKGTSAVGEK